MEEFNEKPSAGVRDSATDGPQPAGRICHSRQAKPERTQGLARAGTPQSARPDQCLVLSPPLKDDVAPDRWGMTTAHDGKNPPVHSTLDKRGAMALAKRLETYWHERGYPAARFWAEPIPERFDKVGTYEIYRVVSNLVNGLPPRYAECRAPRR
jgi:hypothetical protein